jgi:hypothetical protein
MEFGVRMLPSSHGRDVLATTWCRAIANQSPGEYLATTTAGWWPIISPGDEWQATGRRIVAIQHPG